MKMMVYPNIKDPVEVPEGTPSGTLFVCVDNTFGKGIVDSMTNSQECRRIISVVISTTRREPCPH